MQAWLLLAATAGTASGLRLAPSVGVIRPRLAPMMMSDGAAEEEAGPKALVSLATLNPTYRTMVQGAFEQRNKERLLSGQEKYENIEAMVQAYIEFEGRDKGMSDAQCEDAVIRFLQRKSLLSEGGSSGDGQELFTFAALALLVGGVLFTLARENLSG